MIRCKSTGVEHRHETVAQVRNCYALEAAGGAAAMDLKTPEFVAEIQRRERIEATTAVQRKEATERRLATAVTEAGMYRKVIKVNGEQIVHIYKVQKAVHGSGHLYAKALVLGRHGEKASFVYAPGAIKTLTTADKMTLEQAKEFGAIYGVCVRCGATLTDEHSIELGIGPVCAKKEGWM